MNLLNTHIASDRLSLIKAVQQGSWSSGDYGRIGTTLQIVGERLVEVMDVRSSQSVLDVAGGNGNVSLAAARRFCNVLSTDFVASLLKQSRRRAMADGFDIEYQEADAEDLPFPDNSIDNVVSTFGVMFAPNQEKAAAELVRVCNKAGKIGLTNWSPHGFIGQYFELLNQYVPLPPGVKLPTIWGTEDFIEQRFSASARAIAHATPVYNFRYRSPRHWFNVFSSYCGLTLNAFRALDDDRGEALREDILRLIAAHNRADDGSMVVPSKYLQSVIAL